MLVMANGDSSGLSQVWSTLRSWQQRLFGSKQAPTLSTRPAPPRSFRLLTLEIPELLVEQLGNLTGGFGAGQGAVMALTLSRGIAELTATVDRLDEGLSERRRAARASVKWINQDPGQAPRTVSIQLAREALEQIRALAPRVQTHVEVLALNVDVTVELVAKLAFFRGIEELISHADKGSKGYALRRASLARFGQVTPHREIHVPVEMARALDGLNPPAPAGEVAGPSEPIQLFRQAIERGANELTATLDRFDHGLAERRLSARLALDWLRSDSIETVVSLPIMATFEQRVVELLPRISTHSAGFGLTGDIDDDTICQLICYRGLAAMVADVRRAAAEADFERRRQALRVVGRVLPGTRDAN